MNNVAFMPSFARLDNSNDLIYVRGCRCKKSNCMNKYCECFKFGAKCTDLCQCNQCEIKDLKINEVHRKDVFVKPKRKKLRFLIPKPGVEPGDPSNEILLVKTRK